MEKEKDKIWKKRNYKRRMYLLILCMGIGFAFLSTQLNIVGVTTVKGGTWNVYFDNVQVNSNSVSAEEPEIDSNLTRVDFAVTLNSPGDFYEFTVDAVNEGQVNATIQSIFKTPLDENTAKFLNYEVTYDDDSEIAEADVLEAGDTQTIKVRVEYKENVLDEDILESNQVLNLSFSIDYIHATSQTPKRFVQLVRSAATSDASIDFTKNSFYTNGNGLYIKNDTRNNTNPIYYYRGDVNNNAYFAGYCWKIVRTTDTGGTKLIYNGPKTRSYTSVETLDESDYNILSETNPFTFNSDSKTWSITDTRKQLDFSVEESGDYILHLGFNLEATQIEGGIALDGQEVASLTQSEVKLYNLTPSSVITVYYANSYNPASSYNKPVFSFSLDKGLQGVLSCDNSGPITAVAYSNFNDNVNSLAYDGYMYGTPYISNNNSSGTSSNYFGSSITYSNGQYTLVDLKQGYDSTHHYSCGYSYSSSSCAEVQYYTSSSTYIKIYGGRTLDDALTEMRRNITDSSAKVAVDNWFNNTFKTFFTTNNIDYNDYLEDTIWCNDRSSNVTEFTTQYMSNPTYYINNGWKPNGGSGDLYYGSYGRLYGGQPSLTCSQKNNSFTVKESLTGNGVLTYPVGLLTLDEAVFAGAQIFSGSEVRDFNHYLNSHQNWLTMSPSTYRASIYCYGDSCDGLSMMAISGNGSVQEYSGNMYMYSSLPYTSSYAIRPAISIKSKVKVAATGDGSPTNPYVFITQ